MPYAAQPQADHKSYAPILPIAIRPSQASD
jgi:hypothetical protein